MAKQNSTQPNPDAIAEAEKALGGGTATATAPTSSRDALASLAVEKVTPRRKPGLNDDIIYVLGTGSDRAGEFRAAKTSYVINETTVNLVWLIGRRDDNPKGMATNFLQPGVEYDPTGRPGTWHYIDDEPVERPVGKKSRAEALANGRR